MNEAIRAPKVRLIEADGQQAGIVNIEDALKRAQASGLDLVEIAPQADPPVVKIINWGKYQYQQGKLAQKAKKKHKTLTVKQIRLGLKIGQHDLDIKLKKAHSFIEAGNKVKLSVAFKGREITHPELGHELLKKIVNTLSDIAMVDQEPELTGRFLQMVIRKK
ncbi:translation initiation factor IF-3 [Candidatus Microgenomates bacterium]|nr:translation initiation factor IF-3 [Candidatus Microgenomates bacterium]